MIATSIAPPRSRSAPAAPIPSAAHPLSPGHFTDLARASGLSRSHVSRALRGQVGISLAAASKIARAADLSLSDLHAYVESYKEARDLDGSSSPAGRRLRSCRLARRLTQSDLAHAAELSESHVSSIERGRRGASEATWGRLAHALGVEVEELTRDRGKA